MIHNHQTTGEIVSKYQEKVSQEEQSHGKRRITDWIYSQGTALVQKAKDVVGWNPKKETVYSKKKDITISALTNSEKRKCYTLLVRHINVESDPLISLNIKLSSEKESKYHAHLFMRFM